MYKTHLFGKPSVIVISPLATKYAFRAEESFIIEWPNVEIIGKNSLGAVHGKEHVRIRSFVSRSINHLDALRQISCLVQPRMVSALQSWAEHGTINSYEEIKVRLIWRIQLAWFFAGFELVPTIEYGLANAFYWNYLSAG
ncbi:cytochrome P450 [Tanacetum coccineum]